MDRRRSDSINKNAPPIVKVVGFRVEGVAPSPSPHPTLLADINDSIHHTSGSPNPVIIPPTFLVRHLHCCLALCLTCTSSEIHHPSAVPMCTAIAWLYYQSRNTADLVIMDPLFSHGCLRHLCILLLCRRSHRCMQQPPPAQTPSRLMQQQWAAHRSL
jgi:hypothetical protein